MKRNNRKPRVTVKCVASHYDNPNEQTIEYSAPDGTGGLINFFINDNGELSVNLYRHDVQVRVVISKADCLPIVDDQRSGLFIQFVNKDSEPPAAIETSYLTFLMR